MATGPEGIEGDVEMSRIKKTFWALLIVSATMSMTYIILTLGGA